MDDAPSPLTPQQQATDGAAAGAFSALARTGSRWWWPLAAGAGAWEVFQAGRTGGAKAAWAAAPDAAISTVAGIAGGALAIGAMGLAGISAPVLVTAAIGAAAGYVGYAAAKTAYSYYTTGQPGTYAGSTYMNPALTAIGHGATSAFSWVAPALPWAERLLNGVTSTPDVQTDLIVPGRGDTAHSFAANLSAGLDKYGDRVKLTDGGTQAFIMQKKQDMDGTYVLYAATKDSDGFLQPSGAVLLSGSKANLTEAVANVAMLKDAAGKPAFGLSGYALSKQGQANPKDNIAGFENYYFAGHDVKVGDTLFNLDITLHANASPSVEATKMEAHMLVHDGKASFSDGGDKNFVIQKNGDKYSLYEANPDHGVLVAVGDPLFTSDKSTTLVRAIMNDLYKGGPLNHDLSIYLGNGAHAGVARDSSGAMAAFEKYFQDKGITVGNEQHASIPTDPAVRQAANEPPAATPGADTSRVKLSMNAIPGMVPNAADAQPGTKQPAAARTTAPNAAPVSVV